MKMIRTASAICVALVLCLSCAMAWGQTPAKSESPGKATAAAAAVVEKAETAAASAAVTKAQRIVDIGDAQTIRLSLQTVLTKKAEWEAASQGYENLVNLLRLKVGASGSSTLQQLPDGKLVLVEPEPIAPPEKKPKKE